MPIRVKKQYEHVQIGFNNSGVALGKRDDLHVLYDIAKTGKHAHLLKYFEEVPTPVELEEIKVERFIAGRNKNKNSSNT